MCGIAAIFETSTRSDENLDLEATLVEILGRISHRGAAERFGERYIFSHAAMGTNRLPIVERQDNNQPFIDSLSGHAVIFNGEIYNLDELRLILSSHGVEFSGHSDTELVLRAYIHWGKSCLTRFNGIFAFIIYSAEDNTVFAARDRLGVKPLYWAQEGSALYFASELKALIGLTNKTQEISPGHYWFDGEQNAYYAVSDRIDPRLDYNSTANKCNELLHLSVQRQVNTDLPIGVVFSGGLDSAIVLYLANLYHKNVTAYTVGVAGSADLVFAQRFCKELGIKIVVSDVDRADLMQSIRTSIYVSEQFEPVDITDALTIHSAFSRMKEDGIRIALSGDGSDELFAGYDFFQGASDRRALQLHKIKNLYRTDLQRVDRMSMFNTVECRVPFLDKDLVDFIISAPMEFHVREDFTKALLRDAFSLELPDYITRRPKMRMSEGSGIGELIFDTLQSINQSLDNKPFPLEDNAVNNAALIFQEFGFELPDNRYKVQGLDYHSGGWTTSTATNIYKNLVSSPTSQG
ncbi:asparagine synthase (glutamine-hydrolyzing) [Pseudomonas khavaziana]|uniref:asparagine synthase (glutamine-hydrolyzing) n=1 Tax=Pseudomonas khavaziana TaxID=2842351 RepID=UPI001C3C5022|nr:asparagine synthase (glutamine-hydrolyzing) [Pseudomonas khavaziana]MBV4478605.1 asparagine synthase (glutamine-hydrolyzing) [Pseudomonas khavaziana]